MIPDDDLKLLRLLHLADSALPIGTAAHSFGLETLVADGLLTVDLLSTFLADYLAETGTMEASYCLAANRLSQDFAAVGWLELNMRLDALKTAREVRNASALLGRRFLQLASDLEDSPILGGALQTARQQGVGIHHCAAFGLVGGVLGIEANFTALAYLQQTMMGLVSACQRLMPLGQTAASRLLWELKPTIAAAVSQAEAMQDKPGQWTAFTPLIDIGSQRHPALTTRLFIS